MMDYKLFGERIRQERKKCGLSQKHLADTIGVTTAFLGHLEKGRRSISVETLVSLCNALHISPNFLLYSLELDKETHQPLPPAPWEATASLPKPSSSSEAAPEARETPEAEEPDPQSNEACSGADTPVTHDAPGHDWFHEDDAARNGHGLAESFAPIPYAAEIAVPRFFAPPPPAPWMGKRLTGMRWQGREDAHAFNRQLLPSLRLQAPDDPEETPDRSLQHSMVPLPEGGSEAASRSPAFRPLPFAGGPASPEEPCILEESLTPYSPKKLSRLYGLGGEDEEPEEPPRRKVVQLDEHLLPEHLPPMAEILTPWLGSPPYTPTDPPYDLLCLCGPWGCAQIPFLSLDEDLSAMDPESPDWTPESEFEYLRQMLDDGSPSPQLTEEELAQLQLLTCSSPPSGMPDAGCAYQAFGDEAFDGEDDEDEEPDSGPDDP